MKHKHTRYLEAINNLVETDFCAEMELKLLPQSRPYTQEEAREMSSIIGQVYLISHRTHCKACDKTFLPKKKEVK